MAVLLYSYGLSLFREELGVLREALLPHLPASKSSIHEWVRKVGGRLNFTPAKPQEYSIIAVDETVVKCNGTPVYVWAAMG
jgi:transposase-like protein